MYRDTAAEVLQCILYSYRGTAFTQSNFLFIKAPLTFFTVILVGEHPLYYH